MPFPPHPQKRVDTDLFVLGGTEITATAAELNKLDGVGAVVASGTAGGTVTIITAAEAGTAAEIAAEFALIWARLAAFGMIAGTA
jgi:hypothetical protein